MQIYSRPRSQRTANEAKRKWRTHCYGTASWLVRIKMQIYRYITVRQLAGGSGSAVGYLWLARSKSSLRTAVEAEYPRRAPLSCVKWRCYRRNSCGLTRRRTEAAYCWPFDRPYMWAIFRTTLETNRELNIIDYELKTQLAKSVHFFLCFTRTSLGVRIASAVHAKSEGTDRFLACNKLTCECTIAIMQRRNSV